MSEAQTEVNSSGREVEYSGLFRVTMLPACCGCAEPGEEQDRAVASLSRFVQGWPRSSSFLRQSFTLMTASGSEYKESEVYV